MLFKDIIGQHEVKQHLVQMVQQNRLSHALLFLGKEGSGALPLALALAQYLVCSSTDLFIQLGNESDLFGTKKSETRNLKPEIQNDSCGTCPSCIKAQPLIHPDIHFSYPVVTKKQGSPPVSADYAAEWREFIQVYPYANIYDWLLYIGADNRQGNITAQECNEIIRKLSLKSFQSEYKILIMWMPEYLGKEGNKLLKLIEEPPEKTLFILVSENESAILTTILSRCQLIKIPALENDAVEQALMERSNCSPDVAKQLANISEGNYREALHLLQHADEDFHNLLREWLNSIIKYQPIAQVKFIEEVAMLGREKQKQFLGYFTHFLEQAVRLHVANEEAKENLLQAIPEKEKDFLFRMNKMMSLEQQQIIAEELDKATYYIERNANAKLLFHALTIKIFHIVKNNVVVTV